MTPSDVVRVWLGQECNRQQPSWYDSLQPQVHLSDPSAKSIMLYAWFAKLCQRHIEPEWLTMHTNRTFRIITRERTERAMDELKGMIVREAARRAIKKKVLRELKTATSNGTEWMDDSCVCSKDYYWTPHIARRPADDRFPATAREDAKCRLEYVKDESEYRADV